MDKNIELQEAYNSIKDKIPFVPQIALVLGSGLGDFANCLTNTTEILYSEIKGFPTSTVIGHDGKFVFGYIDQIPLIIMKGRVHYYEGYSMEKVVMPIRLMKLMGAGILFLTNAAGGVNLDYKPGDLMIIEDHITSFVPSPLIGKNIEELGTRFPDMSSVYDKKLINIIEEEANIMKIRINKGIYLQTTGPNYETAAEIKMFRIFGADAVGMSTTCEAMVGKHMNMRICGISCITNMGTGISKEPLSHKEVGQVATKISDTFQNLVKNCIRKFQN